MTLEQHLTVLPLLPDNQKWFDLSGWEKGAAGPGWCPGAGGCMSGGPAPLPHCSTREGWRARLVPRLPIPMWWDWCLD